MLLVADLSLAAGRGLAAFSMMRGGEAYKDHWHPQTVRHERLVLPLRRSRRAAGYLAAVRVLSVARERLRQDARCRAVVARLRSAPGTREPVVTPAGRGRVPGPRRSPEEPLHVLHVAQPSGGGVAEYVAEVAIDQAQRGWRRHGGCPRTGPSGGDSRPPGSM